MGKLNVTMLRYLGKEDFRVLIAVSDDLIYSSIWIKLSNLSSMLNSDKHFGYNLVIVNTNMSHVLFS